MGGGMGGGMGLAQQSNAEPKLFVGNLPGNTSEDDLRMLFSTYGQVEEASPPPPRLVRTLTFTHSHRPTGARVR